MPIKGLNVADIIKSSFEQKPTGVEDAFNSVIAQKMADAIAARQEEIASQFSESDEMDSEEDSNEE